MKGKMLQVVVAANVYAIKEKKKFFKHKKKTNFLMIYEIISVLGDFT